MRATTSAGVRPSVAFGDGISAYLRHRAKRTHAYLRQKQTRDIVKQGDAFVDSLMRMAAGIALFRAQQCPERRDMWIPRGRKDLRKAMKLVRLTRGDLVDALRRISLPPDRLRALLQAAAGFATGTDCSADAGGKRKRVAVSGGEIRARRMKVAASSAFDPILAPGEVGGVKLQVGRARSPTRGKNTQADSVIPCNARGSGSTKSGMGSSAVDRTPLPIDDLSSPRDVLTPREESAARALGMIP
jgi:hypothetical protein